MKMLFWRIGRGSSAQGLFHYCSNKASVPGNVTERMVAHWLLDYGWCDIIFLLTALLDWAPPLRILSAAYCVCWDKKLPVWSNFLKVGAGTLCYDCTLFGRKLLLIASQNWRRTILHNWKGLHSASDSKPNWLHCPIRKRLLVRRDQN